MPQETPVASTIGHVLAIMPPDPREILRKRVEVAESQFRAASQAAMNEFLAQQQEAYEEFANATRANSEAAPPKSMSQDEAPGTLQGGTRQTQPVNQNEPLLLELDHYKHAYQSIAEDDERRATIQSRPVPDQARQYVNMRRETDTDDADYKCEAFHRIVYGTNASRFLSDSSTMRAWVQQNYFHILSLVLVVSMCTQLAFEVHCEMKHDLLELIHSKEDIADEVKDYFKGNHDHSLSAWDPPFCDWLSTWKDVNLVCFTFEVLVRIMAGARTFFFTHSTKWWNRLDFVLLQVNFWQEVMESQLVESQEVVTIVRAVNVLRMLRIMRLFVFFPTLQNMVYSILACKYALASALFLICVYTMGTSIFFMQIALYYVDQHQKEMSPADFKSIVYNWNGVFDSFMSLVFSVTGGKDWQELVQPFAHMGGPTWGSFWVALFTGYIVLTTMGLLNVLVGVFVSKADNFANVSIDAAIESAERKVEDIRDDANLLFDMIKAHAGSEDEFLTTEQIGDACKTKHIRAWYAHLDIDMLNPEQMIQAFDYNRNMTVERNEFVTGCMRLRGSAKPVEVQAIFDLVVKIDQKLNDLVPKGPVLTAPDS